MTHVQLYSKNKDAFLNCYDYLVAAVSKEARIEVMQAMTKLITESRPPSANGRLESDA